MVKKSVGLALAGALLVGGNAVAGIEYSWLLGANIGYLSSYSDTALGFYGTAGDSVIAGGYGVDSSSTVAYCGLGVGGELLYADYSTHLISYVLPYNDLYTFICLHAGGSSGDFLAYAGYRYTSYDLSAAKVSPQQTGELRDEAELRRELAARIRSRNALR